MKRLLAAAGLAALISTATVLPAQAEGGDQRPCVTRPEFQRVHNGMVKSRVHNIFDTPGKQEYVEFHQGGSSETRVYRTCEGNSLSYVEMEYATYDGQGVERHVTWKYMAIFH